MTESEPAQFGSGNPAPILIIRISPDLINTKFSSKAISYSTQHGNNNLTQGIWLLATNCPEFEQYDPIF
jgi:hypothetical protein